MNQIKTKRLLLTLANNENLPALEEIEKECDSYFVFDPPCASEHNRPLKDCLTMGDIIPGISENDFQINNYRLYCVWQNDVLIGFLSLYLEYQQKDMAYLSVLYIKEACRQGGIGAEIIEALVSELKKINCKAIRTHCSLRNALALRFWVKNGFNKILDVECEGNLFPENFGGLELMKEVSI